MSLHVIFSNEEGAAHAAVSDGEQRGGTGGLGGPTACLQGSLCVLICWGFQTFMCWRQNTPSRGRSWGQLYCTAQIKESYASWSQMTTRSRVCVCVCVCLGVKWFLSTQRETLLGWSFLDSFFFFLKQVAALLAYGSSQARGRATAEATPRSCEPHGTSGVEI